MSDQGHQIETKPETVRGRATYHMLLAVHGAIRRDLERVERLAAETLGGLPAEEVREKLAENQPRGHALAAAGRLPVLLPLRA